MRVYRILRQLYAEQPFNGEGSYRFGGRWSSPGTWVAYSSEHASLAVLDYFVHLDPTDPPTDLVLAAADVPEQVSCDRVTLLELPVAWRSAPPPPELARIGDSFIRSAETAMLLVPSALVPDEFNALLNPAHSDFAALRIQKEVVHTVPHGKITDIVGDHAVQPAHAVFAGQD